MNNKPTQCPDPKCGAFYGHHPLCSLQTVEEKAEKAEKMYEAWQQEKNAHYKTLCRLQPMVVLWQGKHFILRHENNKLRQALYRQEKKAKK